ncbi:retrotransposon protein, putative, ty1-copia subclass [Tanacetum coccineum]
MTGAKFDIKKFDGTSDFKLWKIKMHALLIQHRCEAALEVLPEDMEAQTKAELNKKAHSAVIFCLGNKVLRELYLKKKLYTFYMSAGRKISEHIDEFNKIVLDLTNTEVKFEDEGLALLLLTSLPVSYEHFVDTLIYGREALTLEDVMAILNSKEIKERSKANGDDGKGLYVRGRTDRRDSRQSRGKSRSKSRGGRLKCYICQSEDHLKRNCSKNNRKKSIGYAKKDEQPSSSGSTYDNSEVMMMMSAQAQALLDWIIDSGCSYHITPMLDILFDFLECDGGSEINASVEEKDSPVQVWHKRLGHINEAGLQVLEKRVWVYILMFKHEAFGKFKERKQLVENLTRRTVKKLRMDNGLEFCNREFEQLCIKSGIARNLTVSGTPQQNGVAERMNRTLMDKVCCLLIQSGLPKTFWVEATCTVAYLINRSPSRVIEKKTPIEMWSGHPSDYGMLRFSAVSHIHTIKKVEVELQRLNNHMPKEDQTDQEDGNDKDARDQETDQPPDITDYQLVQDREPRIRTKPLSSKWKAAMKEEMDSLRKNKTWELVYHPAGQKLVSCKWLFQIKEGIKGVQKPWYKARLVARGFTQRADYELERFDVKTPFYMKSEEVIILRQPQGYKQGNKTRLQILITQSLLKKEIDIKVLKGRKEDSWFGGSFGTQSQKILWVSQIWGLRCLKDETNRGSHVDVTGFVDSDYAKDPNKGRSIMGYVFLVQGCVVSWKAMLQHMVALSTTEAEYMALMEAVKEAIWLRGLLEELGVELNTLAVNCDNQGVIHLSRNYVFHERTKHINVRYHFIREVFEAKTVKVLKVGTEHNVADALTKVVPRLKLQHCLELLNVDVG